MSWKSTAQLDSTRINLTLENKIEIVKTITAYPLVLDKVYLQREMLSASTQLNSNLKAQILNRDTSINNLNTQIELLKKEKELFNTQLKKQKIKSLKVGGFGVLAIVGILLVK